MDFFAEPQEKCGGRDDVKRNGPITVRPVKRRPVRLSDILEWLGRDNSPLSRRLGKLLLR